MYSLASARMQAVGITYQAVYEQMMSIAWPSHVIRDKAIAFVQGLIRKRTMENTDVLEYTDMAYVYYLQKLGCRYRKITKPLLDAGIIQSTNYYRPGYENEAGDYIKGQCLSYRINPELLGDDLIQVIYEDKKKHQKCRDDVTMGSKQVLRQLRIPSMNSTQLVQFVKMSLTDDRIRKMLKVGDEITDGIIHLKGKPYPISIAKIKQIYLNHQDNDTQHRRRRVLIQDGKYCHIDFLDDYINRKRRHLCQAYCDQLLRIKHRNVYADRNETNLRLDSNITNLKSDYLSLLTLDDQRLSQVDLKNSQFRFFIMLLEQCERDVIGMQIKDFPLGLQLEPAENPGFAAKQEDKLGLTKEGKIEGKQVTLLSIRIAENCTQKNSGSLSFTADYKLFKALGKEGKLYEYIQKIYWQETGKTITRKEAKKLMFTVAFASHKYWPEGKNVLHAHFPSIIRLIDRFKVEMIKLYAQDMANAEARQKGNASFAILLQQTESLVFIDRILAKCHQKKIKALSKHDSILCRASDKHKVTKIICNILNQLFGRFSYSLDIDGKVFELREKKKSRMGRFVNLFVSTLFDVANRANAPPVLRKENNGDFVMDSPSQSDVNRELTSSQHAGGMDRGIDVSGIRNARIRELKRRFGV